LSKIPTLAIILVAIGLGSLVVGLAYTAYSYNSYANPNRQVLYPLGMMGQGQPYPPYPQNQTRAGSAITLDQAKTIAQQYLASTQNPNLAIKEIMEFQYNFYIIYYEKNTGIGAFEMIIWKQTPPPGIVGGMGMGGGVMGGRFVPSAIMPEPGPNMMWNTKYSPMRNGLMGYLNQTSSTMAISMDKAQQLAQAYLDANVQGAKTEMATQFYGYYTFDFTVSGKITGMLSVNGYSGQVWYHSWHGAFIQEVEF
jgi:hypothetical protein